MGPTHAFAHLLGPGARAVTGVPGKVPAGLASGHRRQRLQALRRHDWLVYAKTPLAGPATVLDYLSRYTHRTAVGNERLVGIEGGQVLLRVRADDSGGKRTIGIDGQGFIARFLQHVIPSGVKRIRHYGPLAVRRHAPRARPHWRGCDLRLNAQHAALAHAHR